MLLKYENLMFSEAEDKVRVLFLKIYYFYMDRKELEKLGLLEVQRDTLVFKDSKKEQNLKQKFEFMLSNGFCNLISTINGKPTFYVHRNSGIPLIGTNEFGVIDRGTNTIEVKPLTTCNIDCIFCSVDHLKRGSDFVVECDYLVDELKKVVEIKENRVNIHIGSQGDPSLYGDLVRLVSEIRKIKQVNAISMVTNGLLINKTMADKLIEAGMTHFHISLHTMDQEMADKLANAKYPVKNVIEVCKHIVKKAHLLIVPVLVPGINDKDIEEVIKFGKEIGADLGVQNFLEYDFGKKPASPIPMKLFFKKLHDLEEKLDVNLTKLTTDLEFKQDKKLEKPFRKGDVIEVEIKAESRLPNSVIGVSRGRVITIINCRRTGRAMVRLIRDKDNIFTGVLA
ncbi:MAG: radical SAM protein [Candidatus Woesearchaeota archaeon]|nr:radical SAM protein [Candidatus Woesearchaeota archaeon]